jgi:hypothetical protein
MRRRTLFVSAVIGAVLALPGVAGAQTPTHDSVTLTGGPGQANFFSAITISATSGPSGENPTGRVSFTALGRVNIGGPVTCLAVRGNSATINIQDPSFGIFTVQVVDNQPDSFDALLVVGRAATDCSPVAPTTVGGPLSIGDILVVDAPPLPTSKQQCKHGGWAQYGFKNQGQCIKFVTHQARQACIFERAAIGPAVFRAKYGQGRLHLHALRNCVRQRISG